MKGDDIAGRLLGFAAGCLLVVGDLSRGVVGRHVSGQLTRSATAGGAHYEEARSAESRADFTHKVGLAAKEVRESVYWLRLAVRTGLSRNGRAAALIDEGLQLAAILKASANTARARQAIPR